MNEHSPTFITIGDTRIKLSNIKNYGISSETQYFQKVYEKNPNCNTLLSLFSEKQWIYMGHKTRISSEIAENLKRNRIKKKYFTEEKGYYEEYHANWEDFDLASKDDLVIEDVEYLYVDTGQKDNHEFVGADIYKKCEELDKLLI